MIVKIEYAEKAVENSGTAIGMGQIIPPPSNIKKIVHYFELLILIMDHFLVL